MNENKLLNDYPEQVVIYPKPRIIKIQNACANRAYGLFDSQTGTQVSDFKKGTEGKVEFADLNPQKHYDVGAIEGMGDKKPYFAISWNPKMKDNTDAILKNSRNLPVEYPEPYLIKDIGNNSNNIFDLVDKNNNHVGQVINLSQTGDKPRFKQIWSLKMKDDTQK